MKMLITYEGDPCTCPICGQVLLPSVPEHDPEAEDGDDEACGECWDSSWLCRHVRFLEFQQAGEHLFRTPGLQAWWDGHAEDGWELPDGVTPPDDKDWPDLEDLNEEYVGIATRLASERPDITHFLIAETDAGGGPAPAWIALIGFHTDEWPTDEWA